VNSDNLDTCTPWFFFTWSNVSAFLVVSDGVVFLLLDLSKDRPQLSINKLV
jgi:hypothetical protein